MTPADGADPALGMVWSSLWSALSLHRCRLCPGEERITLPRCHFTACSTPSTSATAGLPGSNAQPNTGKRTRSLLLYIPFYKESLGNLEEQETKAEPPSADCRTGGAASKAHVSFVSPHLIMGKPLILGLMFIPTKCPKLKYCPV